MIPEAKNDASGTGSYSRSERCGVAHQALLGRLESGFEARPLCGLIPCSPYRSGSAILDSLQ